MYVIPYIVIMCNNKYALGTVIAFSIVLLSIAGHVRNEYQNYSIIVNFSTLAIAVAVLTLVSVPVLYVFRQHLRRRNLLTV